MGILEPHAGHGGAARPALIRVHHLDHALAAVAAAEAAPLLLLSPEDGATRLGPLFWRELLDLAGAAGILDCGDRPGSVLESVRAGLKAVRYTGGNPAVADICAQAGVALWRDLPGFLDLARVRDPAAACRLFLSGRWPHGPAGEGERPR